MNSGVTAAYDSTFAVTPFIPRFFLLFLFSFLKITTCIASYFLAAGKHSFSYLQTIGFIGLKL